jgi:hypothetical protein
MDEFECISSQCKTVIAMNDEVLNTPNASRSMAMLRCAFGDYSRNAPSCSIDKATQALAMERYRKERRYI